MGLTQNRGVYGVFETGSRFEAKEVVRSGDATGTTAPVGGNAGDYTITGAAGGSPSSSASGQSTGGVGTAKAALQYLSLMKEELGNEWLEPHLFRIGASSLLTDIERQLEHYVTGNYSAAHRHAQP